jgi:hypothetical protein
MRLAARKNKCFDGTAAGGAQSTFRLHWGATHRANPADSEDDSARRLRLTREPADSQPVLIRWRGT